MTRRSVLPIGTVGGAEVTADSAERGVCSAARTASQEDGRILGICSGSCLERRGSRNARACATAGEPEGGSRRAAAKGGSRIGRRGPSSCGIWRANPRGRIGSEGQQRETWHDSVRARRSICANENVLAFVVPRQNVRRGEEEASGAPCRAFLCSNLLIVRLICDNIRIGSSCRYRSRLPPGGTCSRSRP